MASPAITSRWPPGGQKTSPAAGPNTLDAAIRPNSAPKAASMPTPSLAPTTAWSTNRRACGIVGSSPVHPTSAAAALATRSRQFGTSDIAGPPSPVTGSVEESPRLNPLHGGNLESLGCVEEAHRSRLSLRCDSPRVSRTTMRLGGRPHVATLLPSGEWLAPSATRVPSSDATAGVKWHEIGQVENAAIAGWTRAVPWPLDREEDEISKRW